MFPTSDRATYIYKENMNSAERLKVVKKHVIGGAHEPHIHNRAIKGVSQQEERKYKYIHVRTVGKGSNVGYIELDRPSALNALCDPLMLEVSNALDDFESDDSIGCVILTGSNKAFSAGADIKQMAPVAKYADIYKAKFLSQWDKIASFRKPLIAAVNGYANVMAGGCEIAMMCDIIYAGDTAKFGQPEIKIGIIPGAGGTQRLPRAVGKSKAMEMVLTGDPITADEAKQYGLVADVFSAKDLLPKVIEKAEKIAANSHLVTSMCKEATNKAFEMTLAEGLHFEKRMFHSTFATDDRLEGMMAFIEKRKPNYSNE
ncbi:hypothetical protein EB796_017320 [Bugula neritina]|uniref:Probable enoyl-CoA hydratase, mitochondrial n=1 Tax=Bugula neritina TaxID=10212 RepID=A0A7J7JGA9_BUGNE|nr:hypothetical protein EB796_017320 [Bugula neritina]